MPELDALKAEISANYKRFQDILPQLLPESHGKYCLLRHGEVVDVFDTAKDAHLAGNRLYDDGLFSIQEVTDAAINLGFYSHAMPGR